MDQAIQIVGALMILAGFAGQQRGMISASSWTYLWLNFVGSVILCVLAVVEEQWGFVLLEGVWAIVSAGSLVQLARGTPPPVAH